MFTKNFKLDGIEDILNDINYLDEMKGAGEDQEHKYTKKSGKKSKDFDGDGDVEDETDEYAGVKDKAIKKATGKKCSKCNGEPCECDEVKESSCGTTGKKKKTMAEDLVDFSSVLDELTDEDLLFLTDDLIEEVVAEFFYETLEEGFEIDELETLLIEQVDSELTYLEEATVTTGHDTEETPETSRPSKLSKIKDAVKRVASGAKNVAKKVAKGAGEVAGSAVAGFKAASASSDDENKSNVTKAVPSGGSSSGGSSSGGSSSGGSSSTGTNRPGILGRVGAALKSGLKKVVKGVGKVAGKVVKTAKAGYDEGRGKEAPASTPAAKPVAAKPVAAKPTVTKKKAGSNLDNLINKIKNEAVHVQEDLKEACWKGYEAIGMKNKGGKKVPNCVPKEEYVDFERDMLEEGYTFDQVLEVIAAYEDGFEVIFEENGVLINENQETLEEDTEFLSDVEVLADWLHAEGVIENEDQFFGLMEDMTEEEIEELYSICSEATAMAKRGYDEAPIRKEIAKKTGGGSFADKATKLADRETYGNKEKKAGREKLAIKQRGDFRDTTSSKPGLQGYGHKSDDPKVKAKQSARGAQRGALTPNEKKSLGREGYEMIGNSLEEGGLEVQTYSWKQVLESQAARNNPEKYEADQKKKSAPVRGEKTPMPPRGDKRREDFEKWYAANVK